MKMEASRILVVDDDPLIRGSLYEQLKAKRFDVEVASDGTEAMQHLKERPFHLVLVDWKMPHLDGMDLLEHVRNRYPDVQVILMTGFGNLHSVVRAFRHGALDYLSKPIDPQDLEAALRRALAAAPVPAPLESTSDPFVGLIGEHPHMKQLREMIDLVAQSPATVLLEGESGTGKRVIAHAIHRSDPKRKSQPFVEVSCGALPETLLESELFGHVRGSFTGAIRDKEGRFELADGGTIFLDEIDAFSPALQVKLLRVLQERTFERVGDNQTMRVNVRVIAATNRRLETLVQENKFREDLYYRLNVISVRLPSLRERTSDIPLLVDHFLKRACAQSGKEVKSLSREAMEALCSYRWPGNVRELENAIERAVILAQSSTIALNDLPEALRGGGEPHEAEKKDEEPADTKAAATLKEALRDPEREIIFRVLKESGFNRSLAAKRLGIHRATLYHKLRKYS